MTSANPQLRSSTDYRTGGRTTTVAEDQPGGWPGKRGNMNAALEHALDQSTETILRLVAERDALRHEVASLRSELANRAAPAG